MKAMTCRQLPGIKWYRQAEKDFAELPEVS
jgi:hypothetical protein